VSSLLDRAIQFAATRHDGQVRDGEHALPYICHPIEVVIHLRHVGGVIDETSLAAAVLHDLLEETDTTIEDLEKEFGAAVSELVRQLTRVEPTPEETAGLSNEEIYNLRTARFLTEIQSMSAAAQCIKLADRLSNLREAKRTRSSKKIERYRKQTHRILEIIPRSVNPELWDAVNAEA
jgi:(p)ppGpp synthase/HD superfamily hydrolase